LNKKGDQSLRFPLKGKITTIPMKINVLLQSLLGQLKIENFNLQQESQRLLPVAIRISRCFFSFLFFKKN